MSTLRSPLVKELHEILERHSVPEVVEALLTIARHYKREGAKPGGSAGWEWEMTEKALAKALKEIDLS
jgi:hypothetical protein